MEVCLAGVSAVSSSLLVCYNSVLVAQTYSADATGTTNECMAEAIFSRGRAGNRAGRSGSLVFTHRTAYLCTIHSSFITGSLIIAMPSLISTAIALPLSLTLVLLPPLLQIDARNVNSNPPTLASFVSAILDKTSYEPIASRVQNGVGRLLSYWFTFSLTNQQRATVLRFEEQFPGLFAACGLALLGLWATSLAIERTKETFKARGFKGRDLLKPQSQNEM